MADGYADPEIRILERQEQGYPVEITFRGEQAFPRGYLRPDILPWVPGASPSGDGERLYKWLFADRGLTVAWERAKGQSPRRRIRLRIDREAAECARLLFGGSGERDRAQRVIGPSYHRYKRVSVALFSQIVRPTG